MGGTWGSTEAAAATCSESISQLRFSCTHKCDLDSELLILTTVMLHSVASNLVYSQQPLEDILK